MFGIILIPRQVSNFPEKAQEYLAMADDIEDNLASKSQITMINNMRLLYRGEELDPTRDNVRDWLLQVWT